MQSSKEEKPVLLPKGRLHSKTTLLVADPKLPRCPLYPYSKELLEMGLITQKEFDSIAVALKDIILNSKVVKEEIPDDGFYITNKKLIEYKFPNPTSVKFYLSKKQFSLYEEHVETYSHPRTHAAELVKRIAIPALWRIPVSVDSDYDEKLIKQQIESKKTEKNTYANRKYNSKKDFWIKKNS